MTKIKVFTEKPKGFKSQVEVASNWIEHDGLFLFVQKSGDAYEDLVWSLPGGKVEKNEDCLKACVREVEEETAIILDPRQVKPITKLYISKPDFDYTYHMYHTKLDEQPEVRLSHEHTDFHWSDLESAQELNLLTGGHEILKLFKKMIK